MTHTFKKTVLATSIMVALFTTACASETAADTQSAANLGGTASIHVSVQNIKDDQGYVMAALFNSADTFLGPNAVGGVRIEVKNGHADFDLKDIPAGDYAISLFQDVDSNGELAKNAFGIPTEPYGFSNDAPIRFGPPKWEAARFSVGTGTTTQTITLK